MLLQQLHWLPVDDRITYKLCTSMYLYFIMFSTVQRRSTWLNSVSSLFWWSIAICVASGRRCTTNVQTYGWQFIFCCGTYCMELLSSWTYNSFCSCLKTLLFAVLFLITVFSLAYLIVRRPWASDGGSAIADDWLIDWLIDWLSDKQDRR